MSDNAEPAPKRARDEPLPVMTDEQRARLHSILVSAIRGDMYASKRDIDLNDAIVRAHINSGTNDVGATLVASVIGEYGRLSWPLAVQLAHRYGATPYDIVCALVDHASGDFAAGVHELEQLCQTTPGLAMPDVDDVVTRAVNSDMELVRIVSAFKLAFQSRPQLRQPIARAAFAAYDGSLRECATEVVYTYDNEPAILSAFVEQARAVLPRDQFDVFVARVHELLTATVANLDTAQREADVEHERETARRRDLMREFGALVAFIDLVTK